MSKRPVLQLTNLHLERLPGIDAPFVVPARPGVNLVCGPNESGKSSLARAVFQLLWPATPVTRPLAVRGEFADNEGALQARRLDDGPVSWHRGDVAATAPDLPGGHLARCYKLGLLDLNQAAGGDLDGDLAREIRKQMAGGFDLGQVGALFPARDTLVGRRQKAWALADQELQKCQSGQRRLVNEERGLTELTAEKTQAELADKRHDQLLAAREHVALAAKCSELESRIAALPDHLAAVRSDDDDVIDGLIKRRDEGAKRVAVLQAKLAQRAVRIAELAVGGDLTELAQLVRQMETLQAASRESGRQAAAADGAAATARQGLAPELLAAEISAGSEHAYERLLAVHRALVAGETEQEILAHLLEREILADSVGEATEVDPLALAILTSGPLRPVPRGLLISAVTTLGLAGLLLIYGASQPTDGALANRLFGAVLVLAVWGASSLGGWLRHRRDHQRARQELEELGRRQGQPLPAGWTATDAVGALLAQARQVGAETAAADTRNSLRAELQRRQGIVATTAEEAKVKRRALLHESGRDESQDTPALLHELDRLARCRAAEEKQAAARATHIHDQDALTESLIAGQSELAALGFDTTADLAAIQTRLEQLRTRQTEVKGLWEVQKADEESLHQAEVDLANANTSHEKLCQRLTLGPEAEDNHALVVARVEALPEYQKLNTKLANARRDQTQLASRLAGGEGLPDPVKILGLADTELKGRLAETSDLAGRLEELTETMAGIRARVAVARQRDDLEQARALAAERLADLAEARSEQRDNLLGQLLVTNLARRHEDNTQPPVLAALNEHLGSFTGGQYRLLVTSDGADRFVAVNNTGRHVELAALSDGTRSQLLLAARLAFLNNVEHGLQTPLFLDEALTASDPARFEAIAGAVGKMAADTGRQVFYLSSNPADVAAWQHALASKGLMPAHKIDLAVQRSLGAAAPAATLAPKIGPDIPAPGTLTAAEYGALLKVPTLQLWAHENAVHLYYLWWDDLDLLYRLLVGGLPTLGQWRQLGRDLVQSGAVSSDEAARIQARGEVCGAFLDVWRSGRGKPLTRESLGSSQILSPKMLKVALGLLTRTGPDASAFMAAVEAGQIKRLQQVKKEALQGYLERQGHLDARAVWTPDQIVANVLGTVTTAVLTATEIRQLVLNLYRVARYSDTLLDRPICDSA